MDNKQEQIAELMKERNKLDADLAHYLEETEGMKSRMLVTAHDKIESYFDRILKMLPFPEVSVEIDEDTQIYLRRCPEGESGESKDGGDYGAIAVFFHEMNYYSFHKNRAHTYWEDELLKPLDGDVLMAVVRDFEIFVSLVEKHIEKALRSEINTRDHLFSRREDEIYLLTHFLTVPIASKLMEG